jgi:hypothetical protein
MSDQYDQAVDSPSANKGAPIDRIKAGAKSTGLPKIQRSRDPDLLLVAIVSVILVLSPIRAAAQYIAAINAFTESGGTTITEGEWQADDTPFMEWVLSGGAPAMAGFSWAVDASPDCVIDTAGTSVQLTALSDGQHVFQVRAIDTNSTCYSSLGFNLRVDATGDPITSIDASTEPGGDPISEGVFQADPDPFMEWTVGAGAAPNAGSSWAVDASPDCVIDTAGTSVQLTALSDGEHTFQVRAIDSANNCGPTLEFAIAIQTAAQVPVLPPWAVGTLTAVFASSLYLAGSVRRRMAERRG